MIHIDIKKLGRFERVGHRITGDRTGQSNSRGVGWEFVNVCIDDASQIAFSRIKPDERRESVVAFLEAALAIYASHGVRVGGITSAVRRRISVLRYTAKYILLRKHLAVNSIQRPADVRY